jgi:hypothetical protein
MLVLDTNYMQITKDFEKPAICALLLRFGGAKKEVVGSSFNQQKVA